MTSITPPVQRAAAAQVRSGSDQPDDSLQVSPGITPFRASSGAVSEDGPLRTRQRALEGAGWGALFGLPVATLSAVGIGMVAKRPGIAAIIGLAAVGVGAAIGALVSMSKREEAPRADTGYRPTPIASGDPNGPWEASSRNAGVPIADIAVEGLPVESEITWRTGNWIGLSQDADNGRDYERLEDAVAYARREPGDQAVTAWGDRFTVANLYATGPDEAMVPPGSTEPVRRPMPSAEWIASTPYGISGVVARDWSDAIPFFELGGHELSPTPSSTSNGSNTAVGFADGE